MENCIYSSLFYFVWHTFWLFCLFNVALRYFHDVYTNNNIFVGRICFLFSICQKQNIQIELRCFWTYLFQVFHYTISPYFFIKNYGDMVVCNMLIDVFTSFKPCFLSKISSSTFLVYKILSAQTLSRQFPSFLQV